MDETRNHFRRHRLHRVFFDFVPGGFASAEQGKRACEREGAGEASCCCGFADEVEVDNRHQAGNKDVRFRHVNEVAEEWHVCDKEDHASAIDLKDVDAA